MKYVIVPRNVSICRGVSYPSYAMVIVCFVVNVFFRIWSDLTIHKLFSSRADLHRTVYMHAKVKVPNISFTEKIKFENCTMYLKLFIFPLHGKAKFCQSNCFFLLQAIELMVVDAMVKANGYLQIASHIQDPSQYWKVV